MKSTFTRLCCLGLLFTLLLPFSAANAQGSRISLAQALQLISKKFKTEFAYEHSIIEGKFTSSNNLKSKEIDEVLKSVLYPNNLLFLYLSKGNYTIVEGNEKSAAPASSVIANKANTNNSDEIFVSGQVVDDSGKPFPGVTLKSDGSNRSLTTDGQGNFSLFVPVEAKYVSFSYLGYERKEIPLTGQSHRYTVTLNPSSGTNLQEVMVVSTGYQNISPERVTGSAPVITAKQIEQVKTANIIQRLESMIPGVKINITSGDNSFAYGNTQPAINSGTRTIGATDYGMTIRGTSSLRGNAFPLVVVDGAITEFDLSTLNPNDIETITFLKDAAAASIWGVRAANGVIVIKTKGGKNNQAPQISFSTTASVSNAPNLSYLKIMSSSEQIAYEQELVRKSLIVRPNVNAFLGAPVADVTDLTFQLADGRISQSDYDAQINLFSSRDSRAQIQKYLLQPANNQQYNLSVAGGSTSNTYFYSASYSKERPNAVGNNAKRLTLTLNNTFKLFKTATLSTNVKGSFFNYVNNGIGLSSLFRPSATTFMPYNQLVDDQGNRTSFSSSYYSGWTRNLEASGFLNWNTSYLDEQDNADNTQNVNNYSFTANLNVPIVKGLSANAFYSNERTFGKQKNYYNESTIYYRNLVNSFTPVPVSGKAVNSIGLSQGGGILQQVSSTNNNYTVRGQLNYDNTFAEKHQLNIIAGSEIRQTIEGQGSNTLYGYNTGTGFSKPVNYSSGYQTIQGYSGAVGGAPNQQDKTRRFLSYFSNAGYTFDNKYTLSASVRYDDYNNFGVDRKFRATPLWSTGLRWNLAKENFIKSQQWISSLAIRASYGVNGNIANSLYPFTSIGLGDLNYETGLPYAFITSPANPELRWEKTYVTNIGLDLGLFNGRMSATADYYRKNGKDLFYEFPINQTYGVSTLTRNSTTLLGKGFDLGLRGILYTTKDWEVNTGINFSYNTNKITDARFVQNSSLFGNPAYAAQMAGYPMDKLLVYKNAGLDARGLTQIFDQNGNKVAAEGNISSLDALTFAGRSSAPYFGSVNTNFRYKRFTLLAIATYQFGSVFLRPTITTFAGGRRGLFYDLNADIAKRWQKPGDEAFTTVPGAAGNAAATSLLRYQQSDINVLKGDYIRLRELSLTYAIPLERFTNIAKTADFGFSVRNLGLLWRANKEGIDPDFTSGLSSNTLGLPAAVSYNFSLNVNF
ncbi:SusC/RagA family TonB-linked outer membrane protein [Pedobacter sp. AW31-3R]|uniref:SusC/RagA family TonB-linked outer membrane protein n=1 Tax=Pedobacter sp. AW31-3R TaxID=3445781 RepID=UPI003FA06AC3